MAKGAESLFKELKSRNFSISIISHKSKLSAAQRLDLHSPAREWLNGLSTEFKRDLDGGVFLEESQENKIERIKCEGVTHFLDDLIEVLVHPNFPKNIERYWFTRHKDQVHLEYIQPVSQLDEVLRYV